MGTRYAIWAGVQTLSGITEKTCKWIEEGDQRQCYRFIGGTLPLPPKEDKGKEEKIRDWEQLKLFP